MNKEKGPHSLKRDSGEEDELIKPVVKLVRLSLGIENVPYYL